MSCGGVACFWYALGFLGVRVCGKDGDGGDDGAMA
jgi:hypothetical protein